MFSKFTPATAIRVAITSVVVLIAAFVLYRLWIHYEVDPWTRDGRIKANVVLIAPDVSGQITSVPIRDNVRVKAGDVLFEIDPARFVLALQQAQSMEQAQRTALEQATRHAKRNAALKDAISKEATEESLAHEQQLRATLAQATAARELAELNLARTKVISPVNGVVTNLDLQVGAYATATHPVMALIDSDSFYVEGYFEETKLPGIHLNDRVTVKLMGQDVLLDGTVDSFAEGVTDRDRTIGSNLLPNINPTFNWVRLAQRIPVRIKLAPVPDNIRLISGQTATVIVHPSNKHD